MNHFIRAREEYVRRLDLLKAYVHDTATYLSKVTGDSYEQCREFVTTTIGPDGTHPIKDPRLLTLTKETSGNRKVVVTTMSGYIDDIVTNERIVAPSGTVYRNPKEIQSYLSTYILGNMRKRGKVKKLMFVSKMKGDHAAELFNKILQTTYKVKNNSLSGSHASPSTPLYNKSAHAALTTTCRASSSTANANNERFVTANRHYNTHEAALQNIISVVTHSDYELIQLAMDKFQLHYPTTAEVCTIIKSSTDYYWRDDVRFQQITELVVNLEPIERAAFLYTGDMWSLRTLNESFMRQWFDKVVQYPAAPIDDMAKANAIIKSLDEDQFALIGLLAAEALGGSTIKAIGDPENKDYDPVRYGWVAAVAEHQLAVIAEYHDIYRAFWVTENAPPNIYDFPSSVRRCVLVSDTDSTIFTTQDWTMWYSGKLGFAREDNAVAAMMVYFASQITMHTLAMLSANMGIISEKIHAVAMKNEFAYPLMGVTSRAKHYYGYRSAQEGNVLRELETERKGVAMRSSKVPKEIIDGSHRMMCSSMDTIMRGEKLKLLDLLRQVGDIERGIKASVDAGAIKYLSMARINGKESYTNPASSPYLQYELWEAVFADRYGHSDPPPYQGVKASVVLDSPTKFTEWLASLEDEGIRSRMIAWAEANGKDKLTQIIMPANIVATGGVPKEITRVIDTRKIINTAMESYYLLLETYGYYINNDKSANLVSDVY